VLLVQAVVLERWAPDEYHLFVDAEEASVKNHCPLRLGNHHFHLRPMDADDSCHHVNRDDACVRLRPEPPNPRYDLTM
jgi:hypothetical protein